MSDTPRTWTLEERVFTGPDGIYQELLLATGPPLQEDEHPEVVEKAPVDVERDRMLDVIERLLSDDASTAYSAGGDAQALLAEHDRLPKEER